MTLHYDVIVVGAGIAGLWLANTLKRQGFNTLLIEREAAGGGQTLAAQGMIHGGQKYTVGGAKAAAMDLLSAMPARWEACLGGFGEIDLTGVRIASETQVMWPAGTLLATPAVFAAAKLVNTATRKLKKRDYPAALTLDPAFKGPVYELPEKVMDMRSLVETLAAPLAGRLLQATATEIMPDGQIALRAPDGAAHVLSAQLIVFTAGCGNEDAFKMLNINKKMTQRRPLRQVMVKGLPEPLFGHGIVGKPKPRLTVTATRMAHDVTGVDYGEYIWYIGGSVAEEGASMTEADTLAFAQKELQSVFPAIEWQGRQWATWTGDRAEPYDDAGDLPPGPAVQQRGKVLIAWPTKLTYAPALSDRVMEFIRDRNIAPAAKSPPPDLPRAPVGRLPWEGVTWIRQ